MLSHIVIDVVVVVGRELRRRCHPGLARRPAALGVARRCRALGMSATLVSRSAATSTFGLEPSGRRPHLRKHVTAVSVLHLHVAVALERLLRRLRGHALGLRLRRRPLALANFLEPISQAEPMKRSCRRAAR